MAVQIQLRRGTAAEWSSTNTILASGEIGVELDTGYFKVGNGTSTWITLPYPSFKTVSNISGGSAGSIPYQTTASVTSFLELGLPGQVLQISTVTNQIVWGILDGGTY